MGVIGDMNQRVKTEYLCVFHVKRSVFPWRICDRLYRTDIVETMFGRQRVIGCIYERAWVRCGKAWYEIHQNGFKQNEMVRLAPLNRVVLRNK